jgi:polyhydroxybutyrate depolymerase
LPRLVTTRIPIALLGLVALLLAAAPARAAAADPCAREPLSGDVPITIKSGGLDRTAILHVPPVARRGDRLPLVVALHGAGGSGEKMEEYSGFDVVADGADFAVVYPDAVQRNPVWNYTEAPSGPDDVGFVRDLVQATRQMVCVPSRRIYATGVSNGGSMAARLACVMSGTFAAVAPVAGSYARQLPCIPDRPVSLLEIHGTVDASVPYPTVMPFVRRWTATDGCSRTPVATVMDRATRRLDWRRCRSRTRVAHIRIRGGIHQWPGGFPSTNSTISGEWEVWRFFRGLRLAQPGL